MDKPPTRRGRKPATAPSSATTATTPRQRGRPLATADAVDGRERLLDTALRLFAEHGIAATPLSAIARKTKVTPALLHYYFGNRDRLVDALVTERIEPLVLRIGAQLDRARGRPAELVETFVREVITTLATHEWLAPLWLREVLSAGGALRERMLSRIAPIVAERVRDVAGKAQKKRQLNRDLEPRLMMVSLIGLAAFPFAAAPIWRRLYAADDITPEILTRHVLALLTRGLELNNA